MGGRNDAMHDLLATSNSYHLFLIKVSGASGSYPSSHPGVPREPPAGTGWEIRQRHRPGIRAGTFLLHPRPCTTELPNSGFITKMLNMSVDLYFNVSLSCKVFKASNVALCTLQSVGIMGTPLGKTLHQTHLAAATCFPDVDRLQLLSLPACFPHFPACSSHRLTQSFAGYLSGISVPVRVGGLNCGELLIFFGSLSGRCSRWRSTAETSAWKMSTPLCVTPDLPVSPWAN